MSNRATWLTALALAIAAAGCSGSDGPQGTQGPPGPPGDDAAIASGSGVVVSSSAIATSGADVLLTFNVKVGGINRDDFTILYDAFVNEFDPASASTADSKVKLANTTLASLGSGNYRVTFPGAASRPAASRSRYFADVVNIAGNYRTTPGRLVATAVAKAAGARSLVSDQACMNCHGKNIFRAGHGPHLPQGVEACVACHVTPSWVERDKPGFMFAAYVHGIHNSHNMPSGDYTFTAPYSGSHTVSIGFPAFMNNCSTCHDSSAAVATVKDAPVSFSLCMSCHDNWDGFPRTVAGGSLESHRTRTAATNCSGCHAGETVSTYHNGMKTARSGLIWDGQDQSVVWGKRVKMEIASVGYDPGSTSTLVVTWTAKWDPDGDGSFTAVDPCNSVYANGPVFHRASASASTGAAAQNMSILRQYGQGDDWVASLSTTSPGQPNSVNLSTGNTTCAALVATTKVKAENLGVLPFTPTKGQVALQGKPQIRFDPAIATSVEVIQVRAQTPVREFMVADGTLPAAQRRQIVSIDKCNGCHVGSMYQHGGNRVDRVELCIMCHNPASTEKQNRVSYGVDGAEAYDGKVGQTFDLRTMVHSIHSAGETDVPLVYYRSNGVFFFGSQAALAKATSWPPTLDAAGALPAADKVVCNNGSNQTVYYKVAGSGNSGTKPQAPAGPGCGGSGTAPQSTDGTWRTHNFIEIHYPRALNDCGACHVNGSEKKLPDPTKAVAVTDSDAGAQDADVANVGWRSQLDDVLRGPVAASCFTCHQSGTAWIQQWYTDHQGSYGFTPAALTNGRQDFLDGIAGESCFHCHGEGRSVDLAERHK